MGESDYMTPREVSLKYNIPASTVWRDISKGWLRAENVGGNARRYIVHKSIAAEYADRRAQYDKAYARMREAYFVEDGEGND